ncbi:MAG: hypothetical protein ACHQAX_08575 [Gammaproteobacteria bacterium]
MATSAQATKLMLTGDELSADDLLFKNEKDQNPFIDHDTLLEQLGDRHLKRHPAVSRNTPGKPPKEAIQDWNHSYWDEREQFDKDTAREIAEAKNENKKLRLKGNPRNNVNWAAYDLNERLLKTQIYKHVEVLIAFRMAAPISLAGLMMFIIEASLGDVDFSNESVQTTLAIGAFASIVGVLGAAYFIKSILHRDWADEAHAKFDVYKIEMSAFLKDELGLTPDDAFFEKMQKNATYAEENWYPHIDTDELNKVGVRANALKDDEDCAAVIAHNNRRYVSASWIVALNFSALICGVFLAGLAHERKSNIPEKPDFDFEFPPFEPSTAMSTSSQQGGSHSFWSEMFGSEWAAIASASIVLLGMVLSVAHASVRHQEATKALVRLGEKQRDLIRPSSTASHRPTM